MRYVATDRNDVRTFVFLLVLTALIATPVLAQQNIQGLPFASQKQTITQIIGITEITVSYHRPLVGGREIWGALVPYGQVWRAGANDNTTITFEHPVKIGGKDLAAGSYGLHMIPGEDEWTVAFSDNSTSWGSFSYDESEDALRITTKAQEAPHQEVLEYRFSPSSTSAGEIALVWEKLRVPFEVEVDTHAHVLAKIRNDLRTLPGFSWMGWNSAAAYCLQNDINHEEALEWADRSISTQETFNNLNTKAGLLRQIDRAGEAKDLIAKALDLANEGQTNALGYQAMQSGDVDHAIAIFEMNVKKHPESWNCYDSLGESQAAKGMTPEAIANYSKALEMAPEPQKGRITSVLEDLRSKG